MTEAELIEKMAEAEYLAHPIAGRNQPWENLDRYQRAAWLRSATAALAAIREAGLDPFALIERIRELEGREAQRNPNLDAIEMAAIKNGPKVSAP